MRYYPQAEIERLQRVGRVCQVRTRNDDYVNMLTISLPEPGGALVREEIRALESATLLDWANNPTNPYLRDWAKIQGWRK